MGRWGLMGKRKSPGNVESEAWGINLWVWLYRSQNPNFVVINLTWSSLVQSLRESNLCLGSWARMSELSYSYSFLGSNFFIATEGLATEVQDCCHWMGVYRAQCSLLGEGCKGAQVLGLGRGPATVWELVFIHKVYRDPGHKVQPTFWVRDERRISGITGVPRNIGYCFRLAGLIPNLCPQWSSYDFTLGYTCVRSCVYKVLQQLPPTEATQAGFISRNVTVLIREYLQWSG